MHVVRSSTWLGGLVGLVAALGWGDSFAHAQFPPLWPPQLDFGKVRVGAVVEGSLCVHWGAVDRDAAPIEVVPPKGLYVDRIESMDSKFITSGVETPNTKMYVRFTVDTRVAGDRDGTLKLRLGESVHEVPFSVSVVEPSESALRLLVVDPPVSEGSYSADTCRLWSAMIAGGDFDPTYVDFRESRPWLQGRDLDDYDVVVLSLRSLFNVSDADWEKLVAWTERGGRTIFFALGDFAKVRDRLRPLLQRTGIALESTERSSVPFKVEEAHILDNAFTEGVKVIGWSAPTTIDLVDAEKGKLLVVDPNENGKRGFVGMGAVGGGDVILVTDASPGMWIARRGISNTPVDNPALMKNLLTVGLPRELAPKEGEASKP